MNQKVARRTIYVGDALNAFLASGRVTGATVSQRIDRLAERYAACIAALVPARWSVTDWTRVIEVAGDVEVARATDALVIALRLRQLERNRAPGGATTDNGALAYRFEALKLPEQLAVIDVAERAGGAAIDENVLRAWLEQQGIQVG